MEQPAAPKPPGAAISARELPKRYGRRQAVSELTFTVESGHIRALLGPNGAGKRATMRMLVGLSRADSGSARLPGEPSRLAARVLARVGVAIDGAGGEPATGRPDLSFSLLYRGAGDGGLALQFGQDRRHAERRPVLHGGGIGALLGFVQADAAVSKFGADVAA